AVSQTTPDVAHLNSADGEETPECLVLVVDDRSAATRDMARELSDAGAQVSWCSGPAEALAAVLPQSEGIEPTRFDLLVIDADHWGDQTLHLAEALYSSFEATPRLLLNLGGGGHIVLCPKREQYDSDAELNHTLQMIKTHVASQTPQMRRS
ncbi:MAG TPA: hypothetical protein VF719_06095, partial [Abditibacteriaceae bacterium]